VTTRLNELVEDFRDADRQERIELLLDLAKTLPPLPDRLVDFKDANHRVQECQSPVFLFVEQEDRRIRLYADAPIEAPTVRGFVAMLVEGLDGATAPEIRTVPEDLVEQTGMTEILGMMRVHGLNGVLRRLKSEVARVSASFADSAEPARPLSRKD
jgi:cysteine desulfuration protein SufE